MRNIKLVIEYDGTNFSGWQEQRGSVRPCVARSETCQTSRASGRFAVANWHATTPHSASGIPTIQACLREAIHKVTGEWVVVYGASRTDAGVHALGQVANFKTSSRLPAERFVPALNYYLPREIVVRSAVEVPEGFHAQYNAISKVYRYTVLNDPIPRAIGRDLYYHFPWPLDVEKMQEAAHCLVGEHDFRAFCVEAHNKEDTVRTIKSFEILKKSVGAGLRPTPTNGEPGGPCTNKVQGGYIYFNVEADGFLHKMIRGIVGTLLQVGSGKMGLTEFRGILESRDRRLAGPTAPAKGLCLLKVNYNGL
jgi:tRNA pseudouridine38-40 synthase